MTKQRTCEERIDAELKHEMECLERAHLEGQWLITCPGCGHEWASDEQDDQCPECFECESLKYEETDEGPYHERILEASPLYTRHQVGLSWGGPADGFYVDVSDEEIVGITYYFQDWFDGAKRRLRGDAFDLAARVLGPFVGIY